MSRSFVLVRRVVRSVAVLCAAFAGPALLVTDASPVLAHTDLEYTVPVDGATADAPVSQMTVAFEDPVTIAGDGFEVLTPAGDVVRPSVFSEDGAVYFLQVAEPLAGGVAAVRYEVAAADGHVLRGGFSFTVPDAPPAGVTVPATAPAVVAPPPTIAPVPADAGSSAGLVIGIAVAVGIAAAAFLVLRSRLAASDQP